MQPATLLFALHGHAAVVAILSVLSVLALGTTISAPQPQPLVPSNSPDQDTVLGQALNLENQFEVLTGTTDAIQGGGGSLSSLPGAGGAVPIAGKSYIKTAGVNATTLAAPVAGNPAAGGNDNLSITIIDCGGHAHTVTAPANSINGNKHVITFPGTVGAQLTLRALNGVWYTDGGGTTLS
jgi:hypothetical protein